MSTNAFRPNAFGTPSPSPTQKPASVPGTVPGTVPSPRTPGQDSAKPNPEKPAQDKAAENKPAQKPAEPKKPAAKKPARRTRTPQRTTMKIAQEVIEVVRNVEAANDPTRKLAATLFNIEDDIDAISAAIATVDKDTVGVVSSLIEMRDADTDMDRMVLVSTWDAKKTTTPAWRFLHALDLVSRQMPGNDTKAAADFASTRDGLPEELDLLLDLLS